MVELGALPARGGVAGVAGCREESPRVARVGRLLVVRQVTAGAVRGRAGEPSSHVALSAGNGGVCARQRKGREGCVVESRPLPGRRGMADGAIVRKRGGCVI